MSSCPTPATATLALPDVTDRARKNAQADLLRARQLKERLEARDGADTGTDAFMDDVKVAQNDAIVGVLLGAKAGLPGHRATLTS